MKSQQASHNLAITSGEPAGIGPDLCLQLSQTTRTEALVIFADPALLMQRAAQLGISVKLETYIKGQIATCKAGQLCVYPVPLASVCTAGRVRPDNAQAVLNMLQTAATGCQKKEFSALITAPVQKSVINEAGFAFSGHTEFLAALSKVEKVVMMLAGPDLRVALVTTHLPLSEVAAAITTDNLTQTLEILHHSLQTQFGLKQPRILVAGLNPHAGEGGHLGREELDIIEPVLKTLRQKGMHLTGPLPADTLFTEKYLSKTDAVLAMYHDQGLPVLKYSSFGQAVNITLGLPFIRTSVDHGTALELAGNGGADCSSLHQAIRCAATLSAIHSSRKQNE